MTQLTDSERTTYEDGAWYWVEKEGWIGDPPTIAPALYKAQSDAWYSFAFSGIPTREVKVLEPCRRASACQHRIGDARNSLVKSGYLCIECGALFAAADHEGRTSAEQERVEFESAVRSAMHDEGEDCIAESLARRRDGAYKASATGYAWWGYQQAAHRAPVVPVPQGWKWVPVEPTQHMIHEGSNADCVLNANEPNADRKRRVYCAMLAAAPKPPAA